MGHNIGHKIVVKWACCPKDLGLGSKISRKEKGNVDLEV